MSIITLIKHRLRAAKIRRLDRELTRVTTSYDERVVGLAVELDRLRREHDDRTSEQVRRDVERAAKFSG